MLMLGVALGVALGGAPSDTAAMARNVVNDARLAVEGDSVDHVRAPWLARRDDRLARLGLATLAWLTYDYAAADSIYHLLIDASRDEVAAYATLGIAHAAQARGQFARADSIYAAAALAARALGDRNGEAEALIGNAGTQHRLAGARAALARLDEADRLIAPGDTANRAAAQCARASALADMGRSESVVLAERGATLAERAHLFRTNAACLQVLGRLTLFGDADSAMRLLESATRLMRRARDRGSLASLLQWKGYLHLTRGQPGLARQEALDAITEGTASHDASPVAWAYLNLGQESLLFGDRGAATTEVARAESLFVRQGDGYGMLAAQGVDGGIRLGEGDLDGARAVLTDGLRRTAAYPTMTPYLYRTLAHVSRRAGHLDLAAAQLDTARVAARPLPMGGWINGLESDYGVIDIERGRLDAAEQHLRNFMSSLGPNQPSRAYPILHGAAVTNVRRNGVSGGTA